MKKLMIAILAVGVAGCSGGGDSSGKGFDENDVDSIIAALETGDEFVQQRAANALGEKGPEAAAAVSTLHKILKDESEEEVVRIEAVRALGRIGTTDQAVIDTIKEMVVYKKSKTIREESKKALQALGQ